MDATPRHGRAALAAFAGLALVVVLVVAADGADGEAITVTLSAAPGGDAHPTLTVDPATDLVDHQVVTVHGEGFDPEASVTLWQCSTREPGVCGGTDFTEIDDDGTFTRTVGVAATGCRPAEARCAITVEAFGEADQEYHRLVGEVPLSFDPGAPLVRSTPVSASPVTGLADGDAIAVSADGRRPGDPVDAVVCASPEPISDDCLAASQGGIADQVDDQGRLRGVFRASAIVESPNGPIDCREQRCYLHVDPNDRPTTVALAFDPDAPLAPPPTGSARLVEGHTLEVQGEGFVATEEVYATTCIERDGPRQCLFPSEVHETAGEDGTVTIAYEPEPFDGFAGVEDCRGAECFVLVWGSALGGDGRDSIRAPFALDP